MDSGYLEDHFASRAGLDRGDRGVRFGERESMRDHRRRIEFSGTQKARHLVPRLVHAASDDTVDGETLEDHLRRQIEIHFLGRNPEHLHSPADSHERERLVDCRRNTRHLQYHIRAEPPRCRFHDPLGLVGMNGVVGAHLLRERQPGVIHIGGDHPRRTRRSAYPGGEYSYRSTSRDQDNRAGNVRGEHGVKRVAHRVVDSPYVEGNLVVEMPDVCRRHGYVFREAAVTVYADDLRVRTHVRVARSAEQAPSVDDVSFRRDTVAFLHISDETTHLHHVAGEFVPDHEGRLAASLRPRVPVVGLNIGAAYPSPSHTNQNFVLADPRLGNVLQLETWRRRFLYQRFHEQLLRWSSRKKFSCTHEVLT